MSDYYRLHPLMILQQTIISIRNLSFAYLISLSLFFSHKFFYGWLAVIGLTVFCLLLAVYHWLFFKYRLGSSQLNVQHGLFVKKQLVIPYSRIQAVQRQSWFFLKPFGIFSLIIETAGSEAENVNLLAVKEEVYQQLQQARKKSTDNHFEIEQKQAVVKPFFEVSTGDILLFSFTDQSIFIMLFAFLSFYDSLKSWLSKKWLIAQQHQLALAGIVVILFLLLLLLLILVLAAVLKNLIHYYHFQVQRQKNELIVERGFFERTTLTIPLQRIQAIQIKQNFFRSWLKLASVELILAAGRGNQNDDAVSDDTFYLLPIIQQSQVWLVLQKLLPEWQLIKPQKKDLKTGSKFLFLRFAASFTVIIAVAGFWLNLYLGFAASFLGFLLVIRAWWASKNQTAGTIGTELIYLKRVSGFCRETLITQKNKIQCRQIKTTWWLNGRHLGHFVLVIKAGSSSQEAKLRYLSLASCRFLKDLFGLPVE